MDIDDAQNSGMTALEDGNTGAVSVARLPTFERDIARPAYLAHIVLSTNNVPKMSEWYNEVLGAESTFASKGFRAKDAGGNVHTMEVDFVTFDHEHHRVAFANGGGDPNGPPPPRTLNHMAFTYSTVADLVATYKRLKEQGVLPVRTVHHGPTVSNYYLDPDNNRVELQVDAFPTIVALNDWFATGAFDKNPIGTAFSFDVLVEQFEAGADPAYLINIEGFIADYRAGKLTKV
ncbi:MAG: hypothetical protein JWO15_1388 [Sphingomonadales bacterium]|nr:hypothetical protein [Sphingomonadales bacterium]